MHLTKPVKLSNKKTLGKEISMDIILLYDFICNRLIYCLYQTPPSILSFSFAIYKISRMWYFPLSCVFCFLIGAIISVLIKPQNPKKLNRDLISPAFYTFFRWFPFLAYLIGQEKDFEADIGIDYVSFISLIF